MAGLRDNFATDDKPVKQSKKVPTGFDSVSDFLEDMREKYDFGVGFNEHNTSAGKEDAKFAVGNQWDPVVEQRRRAANKPVLTFNRLIAFIAQIVGNRLMNETEIRVLPDKGGTKEIAEIRENLIRSIFKNSQADFARDEAHKYQVVGGQGAYSLAMEYTNDDVFTQKIRINAITDPYSAVFDPLGIEPSGGDCQWAFVGDDIPHQEFKRRWPWATGTAFMDENRWNGSGFWLQQDSVRIVSYWRMVTEGHKTLCLYQDGSIHDITDMEEFEYSMFAETRSDGSYYTREVPKRMARLYICAGNEILEGPFDYPCSSLPVFRVPGWELNDGERIHRWGLIRFLKDPQRLHNYWRSTVAEQLVAAPRNKWLATAEAVKGHERKWRASPTSDDPFLFFNDGETPPVHIPPPGIDAALINEAGLATQDLKDISNIHEAALGMPSNEVSKVAIQQRQMVSDVGTFIYTDRLRNADERCAKIINELIPHIYDTKRVEAIIGRDDKVILATLNDPSQPNMDMTMGQYGVTVSVGPASETKRSLAREQMMAFVNAAPQIAGSVMDLVAEAQDWPKSEEFARRFKMGLPAGMIPQDEMTPEMIQAQQQNEQKAQQQQQIEQLQIQAGLSETNAKASNAEARAHLARAQAYKAILDAQARTADVDSKNDHRDFEAVLATLDQHNALEHEDRTHDLAAAAQGHTQAHQTVDQFANLKKIDQDFKLQQQYRDATADASDPNSPTNGENI